MTSNSKEMRKVWMFPVNRFRTTETRASKRRMRAEQAHLKVDNQNAAEGGVEGAADRGSLTKEEEAMIGRCRRLEPFKESLPDGILNLHLQMTSYMFTVTRFIPSSSREIVRPAQILGERSSQTVKEGLY